ALDASGRQHRRRAQPGVFENAPELKTGPYANPSARKRATKPLNSHLDKCARRFGRCTVQVELLECEHATKLDEHFQLPEESRWIGNVHQNEASNGHVHWLGKRKHVEFAHDEANIRYA